MFRTPGFRSSGTAVPPHKNIQKNGIMGIYGKYYTVEELYNEVIKDKPFYIGKIKVYNIDKSEDLEQLSVIILARQSHESG